MTTENATRSAATGPWARVAAALPRAKGMYFDGCHKMYLAMDDDENAKFISEEWPHSSAPDISVLGEWFDESCGLRFISAVSTNVADPNAGFESLIDQGEIEDAADAEDDYEDEDEEDD